MYARLSVVLGGLVGCQWWGTAASVAYLNAQIDDYFSRFIHLQDHWLRDDKFQQQTHLGVHSTVVKRLHTSVEYQKSLATPVSLCFTTGWLGGLSLGKNQEEIAAMFFETSNLDIEGSKTWEDKHCDLFTMQYPYVQKVVDSYRLLLDALMKVSPDVRPPTANDVTGPSIETTTRTFPKMAT
nr:hypothetical protein [Tanacetum cinerariifolium]